MSVSTAETPIMLTGANGRLAACLGPHLRRAGHEVLAYSRTAANGHQTLEQLLQAPWPAPQSTLLHLAWSTLPATSERNIGVEWQCDLPLLFRLLQKIADTPPARRPHFVFLSSGGAVYGPDAGHPARETDPCRPIGWYAEAKLAAEEIIRIYAGRHDLACTVLRVSNPYGFPVLAQRAQGIIPRAFHCAKSGDTLQLWGDGSARKDFLHYTDFNRAVATVIARRLAGTYNLSVGQSHSVREILGQIETLTGRSIRVVQEPAPAWDVQSSQLDNQRLREASGWAPQVTLGEGLRLTARELQA